jgi:hypothetical protein
MKNLNLVELNNYELKEINGGSEITDMLWSGFGYFVTATTKLVALSRAIYASGAITAPR